MAAWLDAVDWSRPWLAPYAERGQRVAARIANGASVAQSLNAEAAFGEPPSLPAGKLVFVAQDELPEGEAYEAYIGRTAGVPTRDNLHDFFNGLVWWAEPALKRRLHELQAGQIAQAGGVAATRGPVRDALTVFDENGALLNAPAPLLDALRRREWRRLGVELRPLWRETRLQLFGHALMEKLVAPRKAITAHVYVVPQDGDLAAGLSAPALALKPFLPLPVLGVPGWWPGNQQPGFYDDTQVFRPAREQLSSAGRIIAM
ncbi:DUF3025 domain-containing protein [Aquabacterium sp. A7-Y]|uniref:DUF3025 domain-containing protein n=1 Tax=Aquabacterium sp. A7-Y TaxID=1349605 RepID=UPI00223E8DB1|nr:DUF3025 domain-containing protein [Aquabacterium sp. A7-Y]MCW7537400.1 DUF3025 domain-containing protein [Aquabacterium sp. A7-Y]